MSSREELLLLDEDLQQKKREMFEQRYATSKWRLLNRIDGIIQNLNRRAGEKNATEEQIAYFNAKRAFLQEFRHEVDSTPLFNSLEDWWYYSFSVSSREAVLYLNHCALIEIEGEEDNEYLGRPDVDAEFQLIRVKAPVLTADEFAHSRGVASPTIRVWIRRGKLRSAYKLGNTWMIPAITEPVGRGYSAARYRWSVNLEQIPSHFDYLKLSKPGEIMFHQFYDDKSKYSVTRYIEDDLLMGEFTLSATEVEKLEAFLIANPLVEYVGDEELYD